MTLRGYIPVGAGRRALVRSPALAAPAPAVLVLHGYTGSPERIEQTSGWTDFLAGRKALVAYPEGTPTQPEGFGWDTGTSRFSTHGQDDVAYLAALVRRLVDEHCVDPGRILVTGESNGGAMTLLAACDARTAGSFALAAPVIPAIDDGTLARCGAGPALRLVAIAGRHDRTVTYDGSYKPGLRPLLGQEAWFLRVAAERNGCAPAEPERTPLDDGTRIAPRACRAPLALVAVDDGVHTWPGGPTGTAGLPPGRFPATSFLWREAGLER
ncbi:MAG: prolyl oligopeptidase family serine peptidase [Polyangiaceae bacterium]|nr:prolyl oligopeptidase family serine peptidase [Polyangiaceae bacterium]